MPMLSSRRCPTTWCFRALLIVLVQAATAASAFADPRLVRVIWDVGGQTVYLKTFSRTDTGYSRFTVPKDASAAANDGFVRTTVERVLRKGDRMRIYVVNFNPVAHALHESSAAEQVLKDPNLIGPILNASILAITGAAKLPGAGITGFMAHADVPAMTCPSLKPAQASLTALRTATKDLNADAVKLIADAVKTELTADADKLARVPTTEKMWNQFDNRKAWDLIEHDTDVFGVDFKVRYADLTTAAATLVSTRVKAANQALLAFDQALATANVPGDCGEEAQGLIEFRNQIAKFISDLTGDGSAVQGIAARLDAGNKLWSAYERKLKTANWTAEANELALKDPVQAEAVIRVDAVFVSPEKTVTERTQQSVVISVEPYTPALVIGTGVGFNWFNFKQLAGVKVTKTAADGTVSVKDEVRIVDDTTWEPIMPVWTEHIRAARYRAIGFYGTFGTTPDRNIFKNLILGGSVLVPSARLSVTAGTIGARGYTEADLEPIRKAFSDGDGLALAGADVSKIALPPKPWHFSFYAAVTFVLIGF